MLKQSEDITTRKLESIKQQQEVASLASEKKLKELELSKKNNTLIALGLLIPLLVLAAYFLYRHKKQKQENLLQQELHKQQQLAVVSILDAEEKERKRIAAELHDGVGQTMTAAWLNMQSALNDNSNEENKKQVFENALKLLDESCKEIRVVSHNMMPNVLLQKGLVNAVKDFLSQINKQGLNINIESDGLNKTIPAHVEAVLYRVIQESVNNVIKHANATQLFITLYNETDGIDVMIEDNGKGFDRKNIKSNGIGLQNIESRIKYLKGQIEWDTNEGNGTVISIHIPITTA
jgi:signal transduction histidine kinase